MSTLHIDAIRDYLIKVGCKIEYPILVNAFKQHLYNPDPNVQGKIRTQFKDYVNRLATVSLENNMKYIILRAEFRPKSQQQVADITDQPQAPPLPILRRDNHVQSSEDDEQIGTKLQKPTQILPSSFQEQTSIVTSPSVLTVSRPIPSVSKQQQQQQQQQQHPPPVPLHQRHVVDQTVHQQQPSSPKLTPQVVPANNKVVPRPPPITDHQRTLQRQQQIAQISFQQQLPSTPRLDLPTSLTHNKHTLLQQPTIVVNDNQIAHHHIDSLDSGRVVDNTNIGVSLINDSDNNRNNDNNNIQMAPIQPPVTKRTQLSDKRPESLNIKSTSASSQMPPPRPPPRRRQSAASLFKQASRPVVEKSREIHDLAKKSLVGRVKEHALKLNSSFTSSASISDLNSMISFRSNAMKENRLSRDSTMSSLSSILQRNGSHLTVRPRSSHREDESDSSSLQPIDPLRRKWAIEASNCNYNSLLILLREDPKLASYKDIVNGYTALHWAAKFGNLDIIKLIAGTYGVNSNIKSSAGHTPLHVACIYNKPEAANLLIQSYRANPNIRDHAGKRPMQLRL